ncbi:ABC transporter ATP-binding protein [Rhodobacteraceae bacterium RKSG542]|uniref:ABC transporter ATP-binding protein n=1 Tax=Pseudovibrio flavus TaxID=2529854 RepID=UPI0012BD41B4|nr:ABC transporter ATP-binding protein [Pseudovibrio flavus]MTI17472.1 ABC transporter ATP-binding protein [Pseudovibrio flavus]
MVSQNTGKAQQVKSCCCSHEAAISVKGLTHRYGKRTIYENLNFSVPKGRVVALLGKNGVGKTTLIKILMGFLKPVGGRCEVLGEQSHLLSAATRARIGLLFEGHLAYEFMTISQIEKFYAPFYPKWRREIFYDLVDRLGLPHSHVIGNMSCGQRSQVVLGLIFAQDPELMILDDYSMGLDPGYRHLFLDFLRDFLAEGNKTVFVTSHVIQDMEKLVDDVIFLQRGGELIQMPLSCFSSNFRCFEIKNVAGVQFQKDNVIRNVDLVGQSPKLFSFGDREQVRAHMAHLYPNVAIGEQIDMSLEDAFIGLTGKY